MAKYACRPAAILGAFVLAVLIDRTQPAAEIRSTQPSNQTTLEVLRAGLESWESSVQFACSFRYREGKAKSLDEAMSANPFDSATDGGIRLDISGEMFKIGPSVRMRLDYGTPPVVAGAPPGSVPQGVSVPKLVLTNVSYDECSNGTVVGNYQFPHEGENSASKSPNSLNAIHFNAFRPAARQNQPRIALGGENASGQLNPVNVLGNPRGRPLELWDLGDAGGIENVSIEDSGSDRIRVHLSRTGEKYIQDRWVTLLTSADPPIVEKIIDQLKDAQGVPINETHIAMSRFVPCVGGQVPSHIVTSTRYRNGATDVRVWSSDDLGQRQPVPDDFVIRTRPDTAVFGLRTVLQPVNGERQFDMNKMTVADLQTDGKVYYEPPPPSEEPAQHSSKRWWIVAANILAILLLLTVVLLRRSRLQRNG